MIFSSQSRRDTVTLRKPFLLIVFSISLLGVFLMLYSTFVPTPEMFRYTFINMISYFTFQSNFLVTVVLFIRLIEKENTIKYFRYIELGSLVNITITSLVYIILIDANSELSGVDLAASRVIHYINPFLALSFWVICVEKYRAQYKFALYWAIYPVIYFIYITLRGLITGFYPYSFLDLDKLETSQVILNAIGILIIFIISTLLFVFINNKLVKNVPVAIRYLNRVRNFLKF